MKNDELLELYITKLHNIAQEKLQEKELSVIEALKEALHYLEGEMQGY